MKNIHVLLTNKPSVLYRRNDLKTYHLGDFDICSPEDKLRTNYHIYITSDEYIGLSYYLDGNLVRKGVVDDKDYWEVRKDYKKIILTTDQDLIKDGVQSIPDEFLEWFVENPTCEEVEIFKEVDEVDPNICVDYTYNYKIIIPKEEDNFPDTYIGSILSSEDIVKDITELENQSFEGWTTDSIKGYLLACKNIKEKLI